MDPHWLRSFLSTVTETYLRTRKKRDLFTNVYVFRPLAAPVVCALRDTGITPNQVTLASFLTAVVAVAFLFWPGYWGLLTATVLLTASYVLDCVDGMLARLKGLESVVGHHFDFLMDELKAFLVLGGVAVRLYLQTAQGHYLLLGIAGLVSLGIGIGVTTFQRRPEVAKPAGAATSATTQPPPGGYFVRGALGVAHLLVHYPSYFLIVGIVGWAELYLFPYVAINVLYALRSIIWLAVRHGL